MIEAERSHKIAQGLPQHLIQPGAVNKQHKWRAHRFSGQGHQFYGSHSNLGRAKYAFASVPGGRPQ